MNGNASETLGRLASSQGNLGKAGIVTSSNGSRVAVTVEYQ